MPTAKIIVRGVVQGVGFRWFVERNANRLGLAGTVKNLPNGEVEVWAEGDKENIEQLITAMHEGNGASSVYKLTTEWVTGEPRFENFQILRSLW